MVIKIIFFKLICLIMLISVSFIGCQNLNRAAKEGNLMWADELVKNGEDVNSTDVNGWSPILWATYYNHTRLVEYLLDKGANADQKSKEKYGAIIANSASLHIASYYKFTEIIKLLLDKKADINIRDGWGRTPLIVACYYGHTDTAKLLLERGADQRIADDNKNTAIDYAKKYGFDEIWELLSGKKIGK
jgi:ankyrin repeat protein